MKDIRCVLGFHSYSTYYFVRGKYKQNGKNSKYKLKYDVCVHEKCDRCGKQSPHTFTKIKTNLNELQAIQYINYLKKAYNL